MMTIMRGRNYDVNGNNVNGNDVNGNNSCLIIVVLPLQLYPSDINNNKSSIQCHTL